MSCRSGPVTRPRFNTELKIPTVSPMPCRLPSSTSRAELAGCDKTLEQPVAEGIRPLEEVEREYILAALRASGNNKSKTAAQLNIGIATLYRKLGEYEKQGWRRDGE